MDCSVVGGGSIALTRNERTLKRLPGNLLRRLRIVHQLPVSHGAKPIRVSGVDSTALEITAAAGVQARLRLFISFHLIDSHFLAPYAEVAFAAPLDLPAKGAPWW